jgi:hypothetical protein
MEKMGRKRIKERVQGNVRIIGREDPNPYW